MELNELEGMRLPVPAAILVNRGRWFFVDVNQNFIDEFGYEKEEIIGKAPIEFLCNQDFIHEVRNLESEILLKKNIAFEVAYKRKNGTIALVQEHIGFYKREDDEMYVILTYSISDKVVEQHGRSLYNRYDIMRETTGEIPFDLVISDWSVLVASSFDILRGVENPKEDRYVPFNEALGYIHPMDREFFVPEMKKASTKEMTGMIEYRLNVEEEGKPARFQWFRLFYRSIANGQGKMVRVIGRCFNINDDKTSTEAAKYDYLTRFYTKGEILKAIDAKLLERHDIPHTLMIIDIDNFKSINDTFGHTFGDNVIIDNANIIRDTLPEDSLIGRVGGDEFVVLLINANRQKAIYKAKALNEALSKDYSGDGIVRHISASIGLAEFGKHGNTYQDLFEQADRAMYRVKQDGKNGYQIAKKGDTQPLLERKKKNEVRQTISETDQQFMLFATSLMTHARNIDGSLSMLLKRMADQYEFEHIFLMEAVQNQNYMVLTNFYSEKYNLYDNATLVKEPSIYDEIDASHMRIIYDDELMETNIFGELYEGSNVTVDEISSLGISRFEYLGGRDGYLCFISENNEFEWTEHIKNTLLELTRIISIFVSLRFRMNESKAEIRHIQRRDQLTGLYNFEPFKASAFAHVDRSDNTNVFAIEYMDVSNFGYINENYGHKIGDTVLKHLAEDLKAQPYFVSGCRIYSDYFLLLYVGENEESLVEDIKAQHRRFSNMQNYQYPSSGLGICSGLFVMDKELPDIELAIENANLAWKQSKASSLHEMVIFEPELRASRTREQQILGEFYEALYRDDFKVHFQPKYNLQTHEIYGAEALVRWMKPNGDVLTPAEFLIPLEKIGYITELDFYVFEEMLRKISTWEKSGKKKLVYSSNFSGRHFENGGRDFLNRIKLIISKYPVNPENVELEITESVLIRHKDQVFECLEKLRELGFRIAIDDFGTGYSSLSILTEIPADVVKMDKSFVAMVESKQKLELLTEFEKLIKIAGKDSIVEGIETAEQEKRLMECGFTCGQGYCVSKPVPALEFSKMFLEE